MSKILKNNTASIVAITDTGVSVPASSQYTIPPEDYDTFAASSDVITLLADGTLTLNDGSNDISSLSDAVDIIKGWFPGTGSSTPVDTSTPFFFDYFNVPTGSGPFVLISHVVPGGEILDITRLECACRIEAYFEVQLNGVTIGSILTGASNPKDFILWYPNRNLVAGDLLEVICTKRPGGGDVSVSANLMGISDLA